MPAFFAMSLNPETVKVLLIEDNAEHVAFLENLLAQESGSADFMLVHVDSLAAGLERLKQHDIGLIILDLSLGDSDGLETFIRTMEAAPDIAIVVLSGISDVELALETVQLGAQDYLLKGHVDNHLLVRALHYARERKRAQLQLKQANELLEKRVEERTAMLQQANVRLQKQVTEQKRAEEETLESNRQLATALGQLRAAQQQIIQRERMHALGRMANGIAHDFNNALAPILGFSELLLLKPEVLADSAKARSYIEMINTAAKESAKVVGRLREFYLRPEQGDLVAPVSVNEVVQQVIAVTQPRWKDQAHAAGVNIAIRTELGAVPTVAGNEAELREALANVVFNAIDAIPERGTITIRTEVQGRWLVITVTDDGVGMSEDVRVRCLEPFYSTKEDQGIGLGLGSVYGIMRRHEGGIDIRSELGRGTSVILSLPLERGQPPAAAGPSVPAPSALRVLVVDDEPLVREVLSVYLSEDEHQITTAANGREALEKFRAAEFDLVLTDRAMPEMNGDQFAREVKKLKPAMPVILLTGFGDLMSGAGEKPEGVDLVVGKPFTLNTLREAIARSVGR
jgi:signal transduction histidine kinase